MVISLVYAPPFPYCRPREGNSNGRIVCHRLVRLAIKLVVAQFCRANDHEIINKGGKWKTLKCGNRSTETEVRKPKYGSEKKSHPLMSSALLTHVKAL